MADLFCSYCHGARLVGWSGAGPILCPECSRGKDAFTVITQAWREQRFRALDLEQRLSDAEQRGFEAGKAAAIWELRRQCLFYRRRQDELTRLADVGDVNARGQAYECEQRADYLQELIDECSDVTSEHGAGVGEKTDE